MMVLEKKAVSFSIEGMNKIPAIYVAEMFQHIQNILYSIGDHLEGNAPRPKGDFPQSVKENCSLVVTGLKSGSVHAQMQIGDIQEGLFEAQTYGERTIDIANNLLNLLSNKDIIETDLLNPQLYDIINNPHRLNRILRDYEAIWPDSKSKFNVNLRFGKSLPIHLNPLRKDLIRSIIQKPPKEYEKEVVGRLIELRVDKKREFRVDSPEGLITCQYSPEIEGNIIGALGELVRIRGIMKPTGGKYILNIQDETSLEKLDNLTIKSFKKDSIEKQLKEAIPIDIAFENEQYILFNDEFGLLVVHHNMELAYKEAQEELAVLVEEYVDAPEDDLTEGAKKFRNKLISLLEK